MESSSGKGKGRALPGDSPPAPQESSHTEQSKTPVILNPWKVCLDYATKHAQEEAKVWTDEINNLLLFATLFSALAGAFSVESYHKINKDDPAERTALFLQNILALQLNATDPQPQTNMPISPNPEPQVTASDERISIYNFLSLVLSLSVVMGGILCLQWLREYSREPTGISKSHRAHVGIRYMRHKGMEEWFVFTVVKTLPFILQLSLLIFFAGIIELLLPDGRKVAYVTSGVIGFAAIFFLVTTLTPSLLISYIKRAQRYKHSQCPWKSPQALIIYSTIHLARHFIPYLYQLLTKVANRVFSRLFPQPEPKGPPAEGLPELKGPPESEEPPAEGPSESKGPAEGPSESKGPPESEGPPAEGQPELGEPQKSSGVDSVSLPDWSEYDELTSTKMSTENVGRGICWVGEMYLQDEVFADAFYNCILDCIQDRSLRIWLREYISHSKNGLNYLPPIEEYERFIVPEVGQSGRGNLAGVATMEWSKDREALKMRNRRERRNKSQLTNIILFQFLECFIKKIEHSNDDVPQPILLKERLELFIKINDHDSGEEINCPLIGDLNRKALKSSGTHQELVRCIFTLMKLRFNFINTTHLDAIIDAVEIDIDEQNPDSAFWQPLVEQLIHYIDKARGAKKRVEFDRAIDVLYGILFLLDANDPVKSPQSKS